MTDPTTRALLIAGMPTHDELLALLPGAYYMDPPDGGSVTVLEQLQRMALDAARYRLLRQFHLASGSWPHRHIDAPAGLLAWSSRKEEFGAMTTVALDKILDDMLGLLPRADVRADYQEWRAAKTAESVRLAETETPKA